MWLLNMPKFHIDLRLADIEYELSAVEQYIASFESQLPFMIQQEKEKMLNRIKEEGLASDDGEIGLYYTEYYDLTENILPRFIRSTIIVTLWSIFEASVTEIAKIINTEKGEALDINDLKGEDFLDRAKKYYKHILKFGPFNVESREWHRIKKLYTLRNAIVHCNGRIDSLNEKVLKLIKAKELEKMGLSTDGMYIMLSKDFVQESYRSINVFLAELIADVKKTNPTEPSPI